MSFAPAPSLVWFRNDLRLGDNPALDAAVRAGAPVIPVYVLDEAQPYAPGAASRWWLHQSLFALSADLEEAGAPLILRRGQAADVIPALAQETGAARVFWNRRYYGGWIETDKTLKSELKDAGAAVETFNANLLREPWELKTGAGGPYRVFTPFWKALKEAGPARGAQARRPRKLERAAHQPESERLEDWRLTPSKPDWAKEFGAVWTPGEKGALARLDAFLSGAAGAYKEGRDRPDKDYTSRLSPHLAFGEIGPLQIWNAAHEKMIAGEIGDTACDKFLSEIAWREFSYTLLFHNETLPSDPLRAEFADYPWREDGEELSAWRQGRTGYPIVDAGMRQLWRTGWMHNRVRMIVASFLIKDLLIPWQKGEEWFRDTLVDADLASNSASWQWVAGCGADAAPYFRIFNPVSQGQKFDPNGDYVRRYVPELTNLPREHIHSPWTAPAELLDKAGVILGESYPRPVVDHAFARKRALEGYSQIKRA